jgi:hypothetical protein
MRISRIAALVPVVAATLTFAALPTASYADGYACTVPDGMTYDFVAYQYDSFCGGGYRFVFEVITPATGVWACEVPAGFHYTSKYKTDDCSGHPDVMAPMYLLAAN